MKRRVSQKKRKRQTEKKEKKRKEKKRKEKKRKEKKRKEKKRKEKKREKKRKEKKKKEKKTWRLKGLESHNMFPGFWVSTNIFAPLPGPMLVNVSGFLVLFFFLLQFPLASLVSHFLFWYFSVFSCFIRILLWLFFLGLVEDLPSIFFPENFPMVNDRERGNWGVRECKPKSQKSKKPGSEKEKSETSEKSKKRKEKPD